MARSWEVEIKPDPGNRFEFPSDRNNDELQQMMKDKFEQLENKFANLHDLLLQQNRDGELASTSGQQSHQNRGRSTVRGSRRGRRGSQTSRGSLSIPPSRNTASIRGSRGSRRSRGSQFSSVSRAARERLTDFINQAANQANSDILTDDRSTIRVAKKTIFIQKIDCQINSTSIDQLDDKSDIDQTMQQYFRKLAI